MPALSHTSLLLLCNYFGRHGVTLFIIGEIQTDRPVL